LRTTRNEGHPECVQLTPGTLGLLKILVVFQRLYYRSSYSHVFKLVSFLRIFETYSFPIVPTCATIAAHLIINNNVKNIVCFLS